MLKLLRAAASLAVGLPVALVTSATSGMAWSTLKLASIAHTHTVKLFAGKSEVKKSAILDEAEKDVANFIGSTWSGFGFFWFIEGSRVGYNWLNSSMSELGLGDTRDQTEPSAEIMMAINGDVKGMLKQKMEVLDKSITEIDREVVEAAFETLGKASEIMFIEEEVNLSPDFVMQIDAATRVLAIAEEKSKKGENLGDISNDELKTMFAEASEKKRALELSYESKIDLNKIKRSFMAMIVADREEDFPFSSKDLGQAIFTIQAAEKAINLDEGLGEVSKFEVKNIFEELQNFETAFTKENKEIFNKLSMDQLLSAFESFERGMPTGSIIAQSAKEVMSQGRSRL